MNDHEMVIGEPVDAAILETFETKPAMPIARQGPGRASAGDLRAQPRDKAWRIELTGPAWTGMDSWC
jgi:hypothetical protein